MHDTLTIGIPSLAILADTPFGSDLENARSESQALRSELKGESSGLRFEANRRFRAVDFELRSCHGATGRLEGRLKALEAQ